MKKTCGDLYACKPNENIFEGFVEHMWSDWLREYTMD